jgi:hypothetical protein
MKLEQSQFHVVFIVARALAAYREGDFSKTVLLLEPIMPRIRSATAAQANALMGMAKYQLGGEKEAALKALAASEDLCNAEGYSEQRVAVRTGWEDWLIADILLREAKELMMGNK